MPRFPEPQRFDSPTHRDKYPIRDKAYFLDKTIVKCAYCHEPSTGFIFGDIPCCNKCLVRLNDKTQYSYRIYREIDNVITKIKGVLDSDKEQWNIDFVVKKISGLPRQLRIYYLVRDRKLSKEFKPELERAHKELSGLMNDEGEFKEVVKEIYSRCGDAIQQIYNVVSLMVGGVYETKNVRKESESEKEPEANPDNDQEAASQ